MAIPGTVNSFVASGINAPMSVMGSDGSVFYGITAKKGTAIYYVVWRQYQDGHIEQAWQAPLPAEHRGTLQAEGNGALVVTVYEGAGDNQPSERYIVPGYTAWPANASPDPRIGELAARAAYLEEQLRDLQARISVLEQQPTGGTLSDRYIKALERLCAFFGL